VHHVDQCDDVIDGRVGKDAVSEVEDVAVTPAGLLQDAYGPAANLLHRPKQHDRIEIPLDRDIMADPLPAGIQFDVPVEPDHVPTRPGAINSSKPQVPVPK